MLKHLRGGERTVGELAEQVGMSRTALAYHLMVRKRADRCGQFQVLGWVGDMETSPSMSSRVELKRSLKQILFGEDLEQDSE